MKIIQKGSYAGDIISTTLQNRDIENLELFLKPDDSQNSDPLKFTNADIGHELLYTYIASDSRIVIVVDSDGDGYTSSALMYQYLKETFPTIDLHFVVHDCKGHGLSPQIMRDIYKIEPSLVIVPDAGTNDVDSIAELEDNNIKVLIIDHHVVSEVSERGIIINNQVCEHTNSNFVGVGVVYKFLQGFKQKYDLVNSVEKYLDLVAVGQIGDVSDISDIEIRNLVIKGLDNINNQFLKEVINQKLGFVTEVVSKDLSFNVLPLINAVTRVGTIEERKLIFEALAGIDKDRTFFVTKKKKNRTTGKFDNVDFELNLYQHAYDVAVKVKSRQDSVVKKMMLNLQDTIEDNTGIIIAFSQDTENPGISGLIANKLSSKIGKPTLLLNKHISPEGIFYSGSGRGVEKIIPDFRKWCEDSGLFEFARGHDNAFGIKINDKNIEALREYAKDVKPVDATYEVDILTDKPSKDDCMLVSKNLRLFGGKVTEPLIGIKNMQVPKRFIDIKGNMFKMFSWGVSIVQFSVTDEFIEKVNRSGDVLYFDIVGNYSVNNWGGRITPQLIAKDIEIVEKIEEDEVTVENIIF